MSLKQSTAHDYAHALIVIGWTGVHAIDVCRSKWFHLMHLELPSHMQKKHIIPHRENRVRWTGIYGRRHISLCVILMGQVRPPNALCGPTIPVGPHVYQPNHLIASPRHPRGSTWPRVAPQRVRVTPHQLRTSPRNYTLFRDSFNEINPKKNLKINIKSRKISKIHKFVTSFLELLFDSNFLNWIKNFFIFNIMPPKI